MPSMYNKCSLDEYLADFISSRYLCLERAVDEYIQAENELMLESESTVDRFIDLEMDISDDELDDMIDDDIDTNDEYYVDDDDYLDDDILNFPGGDISVKEIRERDRLKIENVIKMLNISPPIIIWEDDWKLKNEEILNIISKRIKE